MNVSPTQPRYITNGYIFYVYPECYVANYTDGWYMWENEMFTPLDETFWWIQQATLKYKGFMSLNQCVIAQAFEDW